MPSNELDSKALAPCPFCGGEAEFERKGTARQSCIVACTDCGARLETSETWGSGKAWNDRAALPAPAVPTNWRAELEALAGMECLNEDGAKGDDQYSCNRECVTCCARREIERLSAAPTVRREGVEAAIDEYGRQCHALGYLHIKRDADHAAQSAKAALLALYAAPRPREEGT